jgi:hypothetical protein
MIEQAFSLSPYPAPDNPEILITGTISLQQDLLQLHYAVAGDIEGIVLPSRSAHPSRKTELWMGTCFECFLAIPDLPDYWELNFSPAGDWNAYRMDAYRRVGFREDPSIELVRIETSREDAAAFSLNASVDLSRLLSQDSLLQAGLASVIQTKKGTETYWALAHPALQADFHWRESFILRLEARNHPLRQSAPGG